MDIRYLIFVFVVTVGSMILHELAHGFTAYKLGDDTAKRDGRLSLNPLRHIDPFMTILVPLLLAISGMPVFGGAKPVPVDTRRVKGGEWGFALVALMGPLTNFILAFVAFALLYLTGVSMDSLAGLFLLTAVRVNLGFCLFNILPIPPLDGSRILYAVAPEGVRSLMRAMEQYGIMIIYGLLLLCGGLFSQYMMNAMTGIIQLFTWLLGPFVGA
ncbi:site-2 protease family protein [Candidatus Saccharibacteria bacterium]|nr:site-2 protease family protein [Candidatus Saccharibacteria bacterium]